MLPPFILTLYKYFPWIKKQSKLKETVPLEMRIDLMTLPTEMFANILKYTNFNEIRRLRRMNFHIDTIARKNDIGVRVPAWGLRVFPSDSNEGGWILHLILKDTEDKVKLREITSRQQKIPFYEAVQTLIARIKPMALMHYGSAAFDDAFVDFLTRNHKYIRQIRTFILSTTVTCSFEKLENRIKSWRHLNSLSVSLLENDAFCKLELTKMKRWKILSINDLRHLREHKRVMLKDDFLVDVVQNCAKFAVLPRSELFRQFTIIEILRVFKNLLQEGVKPKWEFGVVNLGSLSISEVSKELSVIPSCKIDIRRETDHITGQKLLTYSVYTTPVYRLLLRVTFRQGGA